MSPEAPEKNEQLSEAEEIQRIFLEIYNILSLRFNWLQEEEWESPIEIILNHKNIKIKLIQVSSTNDRWAIQLEQYDENWVRIFFIRSNKTRLFMDNEAEDKGKIFAHLTSITNLQDIKLIKEKIIWILSQIHGWENNKTHNSLNNLKASLEK